MSPHSNITSKPTNSGTPIKRSFSVDKASKAIGTESKNLDVSVISSDSKNFKTQSNAQPSDAIESQLDFEAMATSFHISMKSHMKFMQAAWKQMMETQTEFRQEIRESQVAMHEDIKTIKHDLHDPNGQLAKTQEKTLIAIIELIGKWEKSNLAEIDEKISKNNIRLTKIMGIGIIIWSAVISLGLLLVA